MQREGLFVPHYWDRLSDGDRLAVYNGVGPQFFPKPLRKLLDVIFWWGSDAILVHDVEYAYSASRLMADIRLLVNLLSSCKWRPWRIIQSITAFFGVFCFGKRAWNEGRQNQ